jgi:hypothetical protein
VRLVEQQLEAMAQQHRLVCGRGEPGVLLQELGSGLWGQRVGLLQVRQAGHRHAQADGLVLGGQGGDALQQRAGLRAAAAAAGKPQRRPG